MKYYPQLACLAFSLALSGCPSPQSPKVNDTAHAGTEASPSTTPNGKGSTPGDVGSPSGGTPSVTPADQTPGAVGTVAADMSGFDLRTNGFKFENYGKADGIQDLGPTEMRRLFGDGVVASTAGGQTILTPPAQKWMEESNQGMSGGHCEGMAVLSLLMYTGQKKPADFGTAEKTHDLELNGNGPLQREIAYWFVLQGLEPTAGSESKGFTPNQVLARLAEGLKPGATDTYTLGFYKPGYKDGHAVMPYAIADAGGSMKKILIYDNNYPGVSKEMMVDTATEKWTYSGSTNPSVPGSEYAGDAETKTLSVTPISARLKPQKAPFVADLAAGQAPDASQPREVFVQGKLDATIDDGKGHQIGTKEGALVNTMPGAQEVSFKSGFNNDPKVAYKVPGGSDLNITLGGAHSAQVPEELSLVGPGYDLGVSGITLAADQVDKLWMAASGRELSYTTTARETPDLSLGIQTAGVDFAFEVAAGGDEAGHTLNLKLDQAAGTLGISTAGVRGSSGFQIIVYRIDATGSHEFKNFGNALDEGQDVWLDYSTWSGTGPMTIHVATNGNHIPNKTLTLNNEML
jgi:hypothetical protein